MNKEKFRELVKKLSISVNEFQMNQLNTYFNELVEYNKHTNLTRIISEEDVYLKHFYDSLTIVKVIAISNQTLLDIGSGAGFPGIVLKIFFPETTIVLLDSSNKRIEFLNHIIKELELKQIKTIHQRAEEHQQVEYYDIVTSRAVAKIPILMEFGIPLLKIRGSLICYKSIKDELPLIENALKTLNASMGKIIEFNLAEQEIKRTLIEIKKDSKTSKLFPRQYSEILKKPM